MILDLRDLAQVACKFKKHWNVVEIPAELVRQINAAADIEA